MHFVFLLDLARYQLFIHTDGCRVSEEDAEIVKRFQQAQTFPEDCSTLADCLAAAQLEIVRQLSLFFAYGDMQVATTSTDAQPVTSANVPSFSRAKMLIRMGEGAEMLIDQELELLEAASETRRLVIVINCMVCKKGECE